MKTMVLLVRALFIVVCGEEAFMTYFKTLSLYFLVRIE